MLKLFRRKEKYIKPSEEPWYMDDQKLHNYHESHWAELDLTLQHRAVSYLRAELDPHLLDEINEWYTAYPLSWTEKIGEHIQFYCFHHYDGMMVRNLLRKIIKDAKLPTGNWDDYYQAALERACR